MKNAWTFLQGWKEDLVKPDGQVDIWGESRYQVQIGLDRLWFHCIFHHLISYNWIDNQFNDQIFSLFNEWQQEVDMCWHRIDVSCEMSRVTRVPMSDVVCCYCCCCPYLINAFEWEMYDRCLVCICREIFILLAH